MSKTYVVSHTASPPFPRRNKKNLFSQNLNQKFEKGACEGGKGACAGGLLGAATDLAPEDLMSGAAEIQGALCWHQTEGRCWRWEQIRMCHVKHIGGSLLRQGHGRRLTVCAYFPLHTSSVSSVFDDLSFLQWCYPDRKLTLHHTTHTAGTTFLFSRDTYRDAKLRDSEVD
jgi:hypothetical protein